MIKRPETKKITQSLFGKEKTLSFFRYVLGMSDQPRPYASLVVGTHSLKLVEAILTEEGKREILGLWIQEIPGEGGLTSEEKERDLQKRAKTFLKECPLTAKRIHLGFSGDFLAVRKLTVPEMPKDELQQALRFAARSHLPFPPEKAELQFQLLETKDKKFEILLVAMPEGQAAKWAQTVQEAGFRIGSISSSLLSLQAWMKAGGALSVEETVAIVDMGGFRTSVFILINGTISFIRDLEIGGDTLTHSLTQAIATSGGELKLERDDAERLKRTYGFPGQHSFSGEPLGVSQMIALMRPILERLTSEIKRSFDYHEESSGGKVQKVYLTGGSAQLKNFPELLSQKVDCSVEMLPLIPGFQWDNTKIQEETLREKLPLAAAVMGVAFQGGKGLNLLPSRFREKRSQLIERIAMRILSVVVVLGLLLFAAFQRMSLNVLWKEHDGSRSSWKIVQEIEALEKGLTLRRDINQKIKGGHPYLRGGLKEIANSLPSYVVLNRIVLGKGSRDLYLFGTIFGTENQPTETLLGNLIESFEESPFFLEVKLVSTQRDETFDQPANNFEISCRMKVY